MTCHCEDWRENMPKVNAPFSFLAARNPGTYRGYEGVKFRFCPWCGDRLAPTPEPRQEEG